jgi:hypothetical protein
MAFDVSALSNYTEEHKLPLILAAQLTGKTASLIQVAPGIKSSENLNLLATNATFQANGCGFNASGATTLSKRTLTVGDVKINESLCPKTLAAKWTQSQLKAGSRGEKESLPFEQEYSQLKAATIAAQIETAIWQGDTNSGNGNLNKWDGFLKIIDAAIGLAGVGCVPANAFTGTGTVSTAVGTAVITGVGTSFTTQVAVGDKIVVNGVASGLVTVVTDDTHVTVASNFGVLNAGLAYTIVPAAALADTAISAPILSTTGITATNVIGIMQRVYNSIPAAILDKQDVVAFVGWDTFRTYQNAVTNGKYFAYTAESTNGEMMIIGTNVKMIAVNGLNGTNRIIAGSLENFYMGVDLLDDSEKFDIWYSKDNDEIRFACEFRCGVQIAYPTEIVQFKLA